MPVTFHFAGGAIGKVLLDGFTLSTAYATGRPLL